MAKNKVVKVVSRKKGDGPWMDVLPNGKVVPQAPEKKS